MLLEEFVEKRRRLFYQTNINDASTTLAEIAWEPEPWQPFFARLGALVIRNATAPSVWAWPTIGERLMSLPDASSDTAVRAGGHVHPDQNTMCRPGTRQIVSGVSIFWKWRSVWENGRP
jgi:hypothetical protein